MKEISVLHIASFNGNIGDNANHNGLRNKLNEFLSSNIKFQEIEIREFYQSWNMRDFNSEEFINSCNKYDFIIIGGGNFFELKWDYSYTGTTINFSNDTLDKIKTPILFFGLGCDVAKGASQSAISKFERFLDKVTSSEKYFVTLRNDGSFDTLQKLYGGKYNGKIHQVIDGAFFMKSDKPDASELNQKLKTVGINLVSDMKDIRFNQGLSFESFTEEMGSTINKILKINKDYQIIFFPHIFSDIEAIYKTMEKIDDQYRRTRIIIAPCLVGGGAEKKIFGMYKKCEFVMGMRFHSNVCAIAQNIPTIALSSYKKIDDLYEELNLPDRIVHVNEENFGNELLTKIKETKQNISLITKQYHNVNNEIEKSSTTIFQDIENWAQKNNVL